MYENATIRRARELSEAGHSDYAVSTATGVARQTVLRWRHQGFVERDEQPASWRVAVPEYPYLLGLYLGDLACDANYTNIVAEAEQALRIIFGARIRRWSPKDALCVHLRVTHRALASAFPQHGPGRKHTRKTDIRRIFCEHCELLGIRWTQSNHRNISISHRDSTAILDEIVGPKA